MTINELQEKSKYYAVDLILEDCLNNNEEIDFDKALKKILSNNFGCGIGDWWDSIENAKGKRTETYLEYSQFFNQLIKECEDYEIVDGGYNEYFSVEIFENLDLPSIISDEYTKEWKI